MCLFFEVTPGTSLPGGALLAVYYGRSNVSLVQLKYREAQKLFDMSDYSHSVNELLTKGPIGPGLYEALTNYGPPGERSAYWNARRRLLLPYEARQRCLAYYGGFLY
jgi:hypothetical protein